MTYRPENPLTFLSKMPGFRDLSTTHQKQLARCMCVEERSARAHIFYDNDLGNGMYLIVDGRVEITVWMGHGKARRESMLQLLYAGDFFGEYSMITGKARVASAVTAIPTKLLFLPNSEYLHIRETDYALTLALHDRLFEGMYVRQQRNNELTRLLRIFPVELRMIRFLTLMARPHEDLSSVYVLDHLTVEQIATFLNVRRQTLSTALKVLKDAQLIDIERHRNNTILVRDMKQLHTRLTASDCEYSGTREVLAEAFVQEVGGTSIT